MVLLGDSEKLEKKLVNQLMKVGNITRKLENLSRQITGEKPISKKQMMVDFTQSVGMVKM